MQVDKVPKNISAARWTHMRESPKPKYVIFAHESITPTHFMICSHCRAGNAPKKWQLSCTQLRAYSTLAHPKSLNKAHIFCAPKNFGAYMLCSAQVPSYGSRSSRLYGVYAVQFMHAYTYRRTRLEAVCWIFSVHSRHGGEGSGYYVIYQQVFAKQNDLHRPGFTGSVEGKNANLKTLSCHATPCGQVLAKN